MVQSFELITCPYCGIRSFSATKVFYANKRKKETIMSDKELKVMESKVREAMGSCSEARGVLQFLFNSQLTPPEQEFEVGDVVALLKDFDWLKADDRGVVVIKDDMGVYWNRKHPHGYGAHDCRGYCPHGYGWYVKGAKLELVSRPKK